MTNTLITEIEKRFGITLIDATNDEFETSSNYKLNDGQIISLSISIHGKVLDFNGIDLSEIQELRLFCTVQDYEFLLPLHKLTKLILYGIEELDCTYLKNCINLVDLSLYGKHEGILKNMSVISSLTALNDLWIEKIIDLTNVDFSQLTRLTSLNLTDIKSIDLNQFKELPLTWVSFSKLKFKDFSFVNGAYLESLNVYNGTFTSLNGLENCTKLDTLTLFACGLQDLSPLAELNTIRDLSISENEISDLSFVKNYKNLESLLANDNYIEDITVLQSLTDLSNLQLSKNQIENIAPLSSLINLEVLFLDYNYITDFTPLKPLLKLERFNINVNFEADTKWMEDAFPKLSDTSKSDLTYYQARKEKPLSMASDRIFFKRNLAIEVTAMSTKRGGKPFLPKDSVWPTDDTGKLMVFAMQINLSDLAEFDLAKEFPKTGLLSFFFTWDYEGKVIYTEDISTLVELPYPKNLENSSYNRLEESVVEPTQKVPKAAVDKSSFLFGGQFEYQTGEPVWKGENVALLQFAPYEGCELYWGINEDDLQNQVFDKTEFSYSND